MNGKFALYDNKTEIEGSTQAVGGEVLFKIQMLVYLMLRERTHRMDTF